MVNINVEKGTQKPPPRRETPKDIPQMSTDELREEAANGFFQLAGLGCIMMGQFSDAGAVNIHGPGISHVAAKMAKTNDLIAKGLDSLLNVGPYAELIAVLSPLVLQLLANHKIVPAEKLAGANVVKPEVLESQVKTQLAMQAMEQMRLQRLVEEEMRVMQEEMMAEQNGSGPAE